jgi:adenylate cyclase
MGTEIERKFLVRDDSWRPGVARMSRIDQGYLSLDPNRTVRVRIRDAEAYFGAKGMTRGIRRAECEYPVPMEDAQQLFEMSLADVRKLRNEVPYAGHTWEVDVFQETNEGLVVAEIELARETDSFARPAWLGPEVSNKPLFFNSELAKKPFASWWSDLNPVQAAYVDGTGPAYQRQMILYLRAGLDVAIFPQRIAGPSVPPYAIGVVDTDFWIGCRKTPDEAAALAKSLGLPVVGVRE